MDPNSTKQACITLNKRLRPLSRAQSECTIYRVHRHLRNVNPNAYEPEIIAIGPYHRDMAHLKMMEDHKLGYLHLLIERKGCINVEGLAAAVGLLESEARKCYADQPINLSASEFIEMLVLDGCFIIELVRKFEAAHLIERNDPIFQMDWMINSLQRDLLLFENQVPFFVVCKLYELIEAPDQQSRLLYLLLQFFSSFYPGEMNHREEASVSPCEIKHLLDLIHRSWLPPAFQRWDSSERKEKKRLRFICTATGLREANVKFEMKEKADTLFDIEFKDGVMLMAPLTIEDRTDCFFRNLIAYEQYFRHDQHNFVTDYVKFLDCLIDSAKDVEILSRKGIIDNWLGNDEVVAKMVNKLADSVTCHGDRFYYGEIYENVNKHCSKHMNWWMAKLRGKYLSSPWAIISILVAVILLLLSVVQTLFTILQVVKHGNHS